MNRLRPTWRWGAPAIALVFALVFAVPALVGDAPDSDNDVPAGFAPGEAGLRAAIDPETGELAIGADAGTATLTFDVLIDNPLPAGVTTISNQGVVSSTELPDEPTDGIIRIFHTTGSSRM